MLARLQRLITFGLMTVAIVWAAVFVARGQVAWSAGGALVIIFGYAFVLALEFSIAAVVNRHDEVPNARLSERVAAWWGEVVTAPAVFIWRQPFRSNVEADCLPLGAKRRGLVLVHGFVCNRGLWTPWLRRLRERGVPFIAVNLEPVFGSIDQYIAQIDQAVRCLETATGMAPVLVAHSMGGLAVRAWLADVNDDERAHRVITIGTPHHGTYLARFAMSANTRQMRLGSAWLESLSSREPINRYSRFICFFGNCDNIVFPSSTAVLPGAYKHHIAGVAHVEMACQQIVFQEVLRCLGTSDGSDDDEDAIGITASSAQGR